MIISVPRTSLREAIAGAAAQYGGAAKALVTANHFTQEAAYSEQVFASVIYS